jgi:Bacterial TSP3 repeat
MKALQRGLLALTVAGAATVSATPHTSAAPASGARLVVHDVVVTEPAHGTRAMTFTVDMSRTQPTDVTATYTTSPLTATEGAVNEPGVDYLFASGTVTIPAGKSKAGVKVGVLADKTTEGDEWLQVTLSNPSGASILDGIGFGSIQDAVPPKPTLDGTSPPSPNNSTTPSVLGTARAGTVVSLFAATKCAGTAAAQVTTGPDGLFTIPTTVTGRTTFTARASTPERASACSAPIVYDFDTDGDGLGDGDEAARGTSPTVADSDGDGLNDGQEVAAGTNPRKPDSDGDGLQDAADDQDGDGLANVDEFAATTDPRVADTDADGASDGAEVTAGTDPRARPLGTYTAGGDDTGTCMSGSTCTDFTVACPGIGTIDGVLAVAEPTAAPTGVVLLHGGGGGVGFWGDSTMAGASVRSLVNRGFVVVQPLWRHGWSSADGPWGAPLLSCRPATVMKYVYDTIYAPLGLTPAPHACGFCVSSNSAGAGGLAYAMNQYGLGALVDRAVFSSGPPHAQIATGCLGDDPTKLYRDEAMSFMDDTYGFHQDGPCTLHDPSYADAFVRDSVETTGRNAFPGAVSFVLSLDPTDTARYHALFWGELLRVGGTEINSTLLPDMPHKVQESRPGLAAVEAALVATG